MRTLLAIAIGLALLIPAMGQAQEVTDSTIQLIPLRTLDEIQSDISAAKTALQVARARMPVFEGAEKQAQIQVDPWKKEIDLTNSKIDVAKKEKNESSKVALEAEKKALERRKSLAENNHQLRKAETEVAKAELEQIEADLKAWELELELARHRSEREELAKAGTEGVGLAAVDQMIRDLEKKALEAQKDSADKSSKCADKEKNVVNKRLAILETQNKIMTGK